MLINYNLGQYCTGFERKLDGRYNTAPTKWLNKVKSLLPKINRDLTDGELLNDMYALAWSPDEVWEYYKKYILSRCSVSKENKNGKSRSR